MATLNEFRHLAVEESQQERADVRTVHVRVGHDDDAVVAQFVNVEVVCCRLARLCAGFADAGSKRGDEREYFVAG